MSGNVGTDLDNKNPRGGTPYMLFGFLVIAVLIVAVVVMLIITGGDVAETTAPANLDTVAAQGKTVFIQNNCGSCHPSEGRAGGVGPRLSTTGLSDDRIKNIVQQGRGAMPANRQISAEQLNQLVAYIRAIKPKS